MPVRKCDFEKIKKESKDISIEEIIEEATATYYCHTLAFGRANGCRQKSDYLCLLQNFLCLGMLVFVATFPYWSYFP